VEKAVPDYTGKGAVTFYSFITREDTRNADKKITFAVTNKGSVRMIPLENFVLLSCGLPTWRNGSLGQAKDIKPSSTHPPDPLPQR
jgi:hypothetical protein